jgi:hypothetical protein
MNDYLEYAASISAPSAIPSEDRATRYAQAERYLTMLDEDAESFCFQTFDDSPEKRPHLARTVHGRLDDVWTELDALNQQGAGVFVAPNKVADRAQRTAANVTMVRSVFADFDPPKTNAAPEIYPIPPMMVVQSSPGKAHPYWTVEGLPLGDFKLTQQYIAEALGSDPVVCDLPRVMRVPGFYHAKDPQNRHLVLILTEDSRLPYKAHEVAAAFPPKVNGHPISPGQRNDTLFRFGRSLRAKGKSETEILAALKAENAEKCDPPLDEHEIQLVCGSVCTKEAGLSSDFARLLTGEHTIEGESLGESRDGRRRVNSRNKARAAAWLRNEIGQNELSGLFRRGDTLVFTPRIGEEGYIQREGDMETDGPAQVRMMSEQALKTMVELRYAVGRNEQTKSEDGVPGPLKWIPNMFPRESVCHGMEAAKMGECENLRELKGITHTPTMRPDGTILTTNGYDAWTKLLYLPSGVAGPAVGECPSASDVRGARDFLMSIVEQFPFVDENHAANWFGALFTPIMRCILPPPYPMFIIDAPSPAAGKGHLAMILREVHGGVLRAGLASDEAEMKKGLLGILSTTTAPVVQFDNVRGKVSSVTIEALLTSKTYTDRPLGVTDSMTVANDRLWVMTGNNAEIGGDMARRTFWITIDPAMPKPQERTGFKLNLPEWVPANRGKIIAALLTIARGWVVAGKPSAPQKRSDDYATWDAAIEGLLHWAGFPGQFGHIDPKHADTTEDQEWEFFLRKCADVMGIGRLFRAADVVGALSSNQLDPVHLPGDLPDKWSRCSNTVGFTRSLGKWLSNRSGRFVGDMTVRKVEDRFQGNGFRLETFSR